MNTGNIVWKIKPPGPEQIELERMFNAREIPISATPDSVRQSSEIFKKFNARVFAAKFRATKAKFGGFAVNDSVGECGSGQIPELGPSQGAAIALKPMQPPQEPQSFRYGDVSQMDILNPPFSVWTYRDFRQQADFVCVAVVMFSGSRISEIQISEEGMQLTIRFTWPSAIFNAEHLFNQAIKAKQLSIDHPKVHAFSSHMLDSGIAPKSNPQGEMSIAFPCKVRREVSSWKKEAVQVDSTKIALLEFTAYQNDVIIQSADTSLDFD